MADFIQHAPCGSCGSSDAKAIYSDGGTHCFSCNEHTFPGKEEPLTSEFIVGTFSPLAKRNITLDTCKVFNYKTGEYLGKPVHIANYYKDNKIVAQKLRFQDKTFSWIGNPSEASFFGSNLWGNGKKLVVTEGEIDAMSVSQVQNNQWPVISLKDGAQSAVKAVKQNLNYFNNFEEIILMFDMDEAGQKAAQDVAKLLPIGKVSIASLPAKDANDMLVQGKDADLRNAIWRAAPYRPDGIISGDEIYQRIITRDYTSDFNYPWPQVNKMTHGIRKGEIVLLTAGTGMGKSSIARQISYNLLTSKKKVGFISLEESVDFTALSLIGLHCNKRFHLNTDIKANTELKQAFDEVIDHRGFFYDHFGSLDEERLIEVIRYFAIANECEYVVLDHISMACSGSNASEERAVIDTVMTNLRRVVEECKIGLFIVSHLRRLNGDKGHEDGADVNLSHLRGSGSLGQIPNIILAIQTDTKDVEKRQIKVLKNRFSGDIGLADELAFNKTTGHLTEDSMTVNEDFE